MSHPEQTQLGPKPGTGTPCHSFKLKHGAYAAGIGFLVLFPDVVVHAVLQLLHVIIGSLELTVEHALQEALQVSRHTAQIMTAWIGLAALAGLIGWLYRWLARLLPVLALGPAYLRTVTLAGLVRWLGASYGSAKSTGSRRAPLRNGYTD